MVYLYALSKREAGDMVRLRFYLMPDGCMTRSTFYRAVDELKKAGFLETVLEGEFHNKKTIYELKRF